MYADSDSADILNWMSRCRINCGTVVEANILILFLNMPNFTYIFVGSYLRANIFRSINYVRQFPFAYSKNYLIFAKKNVATLQLSF